MFKIEICFIYTKISVRTLERALLIGESIRSEKIKSSNVIIIIIIIIIIVLMRIKIARIAIKISFQIRMSL